MAASKKRGMAFMSPGPGAARERFAPQIWHELERALRDSEMVEPGEPMPSFSAGYELKRLIEGAEANMQAQMHIPQVEFFEGSIRLTWNWPDRNVRAVLASRPDRRSYIYHEDVANGLGQNAGTTELTSENLATWLSK